MTRNELMKLNKYSLVKTIMELQDQVNELINVKDKYYEENLIISQEILNLQEENDYLKMNSPEQNIEHFRIIKENKRKIDLLRKQNKELQEENEHLRTQVNTYENVIDKALDKITTEQLYTNYSWGKTYYAQLMKNLRNILEGKDNE